MRTVCCVAVVEAGEAVAVATLTGLATLTNRVHSRITALDRRIDFVELEMAKTYVSKEEYIAAVAKLEDHMVRIEGKLDTFIQNYPGRYNN